jgi:hypothetical protein
MVVDPTTAAAELEGASLSSLVRAVAAADTAAVAVASAGLEEEGSGALLRDDDGLPERGGVCLFVDGSCSGAGAGATEDILLRRGTLTRAASASRRPLSTSRPWSVAPPSGSPRATPPDRIVLQTVHDVGLTSPRTIRMRVVTGNRGARSQYRNHGIACWKFCRCHRIVASPPPLPPSSWILLLLPNVMRQAAPALARNLRLLPLPLLRGM